MNPSTARASSSSSSKGAAQGSASTNKGSTPSSGRVLSSSATGSTSSSARGLSSSAMGSVPTAKGSTSSSARGSSSSATGSTSAASSSASPLAAMAESSAANTETMLADPSTRSSWAAAGFDVEAEGSQAEEADVIVEPAAAAATEVRLSREQVARFEELGASQRAANGNVDLERLADIGGCQLGPGQEVEEATELAASASNGTSQVERIQPASGSASSSASSSRATDSGAAHVLCGRPATVEAWAISGRKRFATLTAAAIVDPAQLPAILLRCLEEKDEYVVLDSIAAIKTTALFHQKANGAVYQRVPRGRAIVVRHVLGRARDSALMYIVYVPRGYTKLHEVIRRFAAPICSDWKPASVKDSKRVIANLDRDYPAPWADVVRDDADMASSGRPAPSLPRLWRAPRDKVTSEAVVAVSDTVRYLELLDDESRNVGPRLLNHVGRHGIQRLLQLKLGETSTILAGAVFDAQDCVVSIDFKFNCDVNEATRTRSRYLGDSDVLDHPPSKNHRDRLAYSGHAALRPSPIPKNWDAEFGYVLAVIPAYSVSYAVAVHRPPSAASSAMPLVLAYGETGRSRIPRDMALRVINRLRPVADLRFGLRLRDKVLAEPGSVDFSDPGKVAYVSCSRRNADSTRTTPTVLELYPEHSRWLDDHVDLLRSAKAIPVVATLLASCGGILGGDKATIERLLRAKRAERAPELDSLNRDTLATVRKRANDVLALGQAQQAAIPWTRENRIKEVGPGFRVSKAARPRGSNRGRE